MMNTLCLSDCCCCPSTLADQYGLTDSNIPLDPNIPALTRVAACLWTCEFMNGNEAQSFALLRYRDTHAQVPSRKCKWVLGWFTNGGRDASGPADPPDLTNDPDWWMFPGMQIPKIAYPSELHEPSPNPLNFGPPTGKYTGQWEVTVIEG